MTSRPLVSVQDCHTGKLTDKKMPLPGVFSAPISNLNKNRRQAHGVDPKQGHKHSAESWGTGRAVARIPRVSGSGTHRSGQAAFGNQCRKGRMFAPLKTWRRWHRRVNIKQKRHAVAAAIAASGLVPLVLARGHKLQNVVECPLVVDDSLENVSKTKSAVAALKVLGVYDDVKRVMSSKTLRAGKGKLRNKRYHQKTGPLIVYGTENALLRKGFRNVPGVEVCHVSRLNLLQLAPGGQLGRFVVWTASAFAVLNKNWGTYSFGAAEKDGYSLKREVMWNADLPRIINSNEVQSVVNPAKTDAILHDRQKKNPLVNKQAMDWLNPNAKLQRAVATKANEDARKRRQDALTAKRSMLTAGQKKELKSRKRVSKSWIKAMGTLQAQADLKAIEEENVYHQAQLDLIGKDEGPEEVVVKVKEEVKEAKPAKAAKGDPKAPAAGTAATPAPAAAKKK